MHKWKERQENSMKESVDWQTKTKKKGVNMPFNLTSHAFPTLNASQKAERPISRDNFYTEYKNLAYVIGTDTLKDMRFILDPNYLRDMVNFLVVDRNEHIEQLRLDFSRAKNIGNILHIPKAQYEQEKIAIQAWAGSLVNDVKENLSQDKTSSPVRENAWVGVSYAKKKSTRTPTEKKSTFSENVIKRQAKKEEEMAWQDNLVSLGFPISLIKEFYSFHPEMEHKSLAVVADAMFRFKQNYNSHEIEKNVHAFGSGLHGDMQHAAAYAAPACHALTYAAPVAYGGPHGMTYAAPVAYGGPHAMTYAAMAYDPAHAMTYAAPVQYGDAHALTCAAPLSRLTYDYDYSIKR